MLTQDIKRSQEAFDEDGIYCRKLGHYLSFKYCRTTSHDLACEKILDCWNHRPDILDFVKSNLNAEVSKHIGQTPKPKMATILELIEKAKARNSD